MYEAFLLLGAVLVHMVVSIETLEPAMNLTCYGCSTVKETFTRKSCEQDTCDGFCQKVNARDGFKIYSEVRQCVPACKHVDGAYTKDIYINVFCCNTTLCNSSLDHRPALTMKLLPLVPVSVWSYLHGLPG